ncbi:zinc finger MYM-type protein 1-like [Physella acuta]|uniref:zinc finger MYM-type protein 1-like n=1 Tax=Physella acuta TaxID=109671 RepID=UPI0027DBCE09|nr:zinc finger MYM-type protein 1-like [Physella acuta]
MTSWFKQWKSAHEVLSRHENSKQHIDSLAALCSRKSTGQIDMKLVTQYESEIQYWRQVLHRIVSVVQFLCIRGLPFRGRTEEVGSPNNGNYLGLLELLSQYDTFLAEHMRIHANKGRGHTSYISSTICEEMIELMGQKVLSVIVDEIKTAKYFSISVDSTPDVSHVDQLTIVIRYVQDTGPIERFLKFVPMFSHTGSEIANLILTFLEENGIDIKNCRGQSYDNASNMSGKYNGVQAKIREKCDIALYVPCTAHSLNLVGSCAAECCPTSVGFFNLLQGLYSWLSASTHRWHIHNKHMNGLPVAKALSETRWSARHDAVKALNRGYKENISALEELAADENQPLKCRAEAEGYLKSLQKLETVILLEVWDTILERLHKTNVSLQEKGLSLNTAVNLLKSVLLYIESQRNEFASFESKGKIKCEVKDYTYSNRRPLKRKRQFDESKVSEMQLSPREKFKTEVFICVIDHLTTALHHRLDSYKTVQKMFDFFSDLTNLSTGDITGAATKLINKYPDDFEECFSSELIQFAELFKSIHGGKEQNGYNDSIELEMLMFLNRFKCIQSFPNVHIALRIYLCMMTSNCSGERSFSKMKKIKSDLRSTMGQQRLSMLSLMSIENDIVSALNYTKLIEEFAIRKARKCSL